jgi:phenylpyruvate tautomerase PptA (4-oxalocrotonate tautomerase family)
VHIDEVAAENVFMGDTPMAAASPVGRAALIQTHVMAGPWTNEMKAALFERLEAVVRDVADMPKQGTGADFWMTIVEVPDGGWGVGGRPVSIARLAPVFTEDRQTRIRQYLAGTS